jgi:hypothetical protein
VHGSRATSHIEFWRVGGDHETDVVMASRDYWWNRGFISWDSLISACKTIRLDVSLKCANRPFFVGSCRAERYRASSAASSGGEAGG